jgi:hypothetical protein
MLIRCGVSENTDEIVKEINQSFSDFANGKIAEGIAAVVSRAMKILFGSYSANSASESR